MDEELDDLQLVLRPVVGKSRSMGRLHSAELVSVPQGPHSCLSFQVQLSISVFQSPVGLFALWPAVGQSPYTMPLCHMDLSITRQSQGLVLSRLINTYKQRINTDVP